MSDDKSEIIPAWLEFHDMEVSGTRWEEGALIVTFSFGTVYDEAYTYNGYRTGEIHFGEATVSGAFPVDWEEETWLWSGEITVDSEKLSNLPISETSLDVAHIETRFDFTEGEQTRILSSSIRVHLLGLYKSDRPAWRSTQR